MAKFIELHYKGCEICFNLEYIIRFCPVANGKHTELVESDNSNVIVDESYETVKSEILKSDSSKEI